MFDLSDLLVFVVMWGAGFMAMLIIYDHDEPFDYVKSSLWFVVFPYFFVSSFWETDYDDPNELDG